MDFLSLSNILSYPFVFVLSIECEINIIFSYKDCCLLFVPAQSMQSFMKTVIRFRSIYLNYMRVIYAPLGKYASEHTPKDFTACVWSVMLMSLQRVGCYDP